LIRIPANCQQVIADISLTVCVKALAQVFNIATSRRLPVSFGWQPSQSESTITSWAQLRFDGRRFPTEKASP
jgi:hypothetical protein